MPPLVRSSQTGYWIPACAGMTNLTHGGDDVKDWILACAGMTDSAHLYHRDEKPTITDWLRNSNKLRLERCSVASRAT